MALLKVSSEGLVSGGRVLSRVLDCEVQVDGTHLEHVLEWQVEGAIMSLINARNLQMECARVLNETFLVPVLTYGREIMLWEEEEISRIAVVQMENHRGLLGIRSMDRIVNKGNVQSDKGDRRRN